MRRLKYENIYRRLSIGIRGGALMPDQRLPSVRNLAQQEGVSLNTVLGAYSLLLAEGYIYSRDRSGYYVSRFEAPLMEEPEMPAEPKVPETDRGKPLVDLSANLVDSSLFPYSTLRQLYRQALNGENIALLENAGPPLGEESLRRSIASFVRRFKGLDCHQGSVAVGNGSSYHLQTLTALFGTRPAFLVETPGFTSTHEIVADTGCEIIGIPVDGEGASIEAIRRESLRFGGRPVMLHISPSHQFPLGTTMTAPRRMAILNWANESPMRFVVEDDYDSDFRYNGRPMASLASMDTMGRVIYIGTFSRTLTPSIRISYMILPRTLVDAYSSRFSKYPCPVSRIDQKAVSLFMDNGCYERHISRMRRIYRSRRDLMLGAIMASCPSARIRGHEAGLHFIARFPMPEEDLIESAGASGFRMQGTGTGWTIIGYAHLSEKEISDFGSFLKSMFQTDSTCGIQGSDRPPSGAPY